MCLTCVEQIVHIPCNSKEPFRTPIILVPYTGSSLERTCPCKVMKALEEKGSDSVPTCTQNCNSEKWINPCFLYNFMDRTLNISLLTCNFPPLVIRILWAWSSRSFSSKIRLPPEMFRYYSFYSHIMYRWMADGISSKNCMLENRLNKDHMKLCQICRLISDLP